MILIYARVSTVEQAAAGATSLEEQERRGRALATLRGADQFEVQTYIDAGVSGAVPLARRPEGGRMLADARPGDAIVAVKMDRLFRSAIDALTTAKELAARGVDLILADMGIDPVTANGAAKLFFGLLAMVAEFERERIEERTRDGREAKRARSGCIGAVPYGYKKIGKGRESQLVVDVDERQVLVTVRKLAQNRTVWAITKELHRRGIVSRSGKPFQMVQVQRMCREEVA